MAAAELYDQAADRTEDQNTKDQEQRQQIAATFTKEVDVTAPGDVNIDPTMALVLSGTGTAFDQSYIIYQITHTFHFEHGYRMNVIAKNQDESGGSGGGGDATAGGAPADTFPSVQGFE
jgi:phage protein D